MPKSKFPGFSFELLRFLDELARHNDRQWFTEHKPRYEKLVLEPALEFIEAMREPLKKISPHFLAIPKRQGGSLMRVYRDVRFSKDKRPYKTNVGIQFRHEKGKDVHSPSFYFHIATDQAFLAAGVWHPDGQALKKVRKAIDKRPADWKKANNGKAFKSRFQPSGDSLKRPPKGYTAEHPLIEDLKRKDHIAIANLDHDALFSPDIVKQTATAFRTTQPYMAFLCQAIGVKF